MHVNFEVTNWSLFRFVDETDPEKITSVESLLFDYQTLRVATGNFSEENKLGEGGFGAVYKVRLLQQSSFTLQHEFVQYCADAFLSRERYRMDKK